MGIRRTEITIISKQFRTELRQVKDKKGLTWDEIGKLCGVTGKRASTFARNRVEVGPVTLKRIKTLKKALGMKTKELTQTLMKAKERGKWL